MWFVFLRVGRKLAHDAHLLWFRIGGLSRACPLLGSTVPERTGYRSSPLVTRERYLVTGAQGERLRLVGTT